MQKIEDMDLLILFELSAYESNIGEKAKKEIARRGKETDWNVDKM